MINVENYFNDTKLLEKMVKDHSFIKLMNKEQIYSIRANFFNGSTDNNYIDIYKEDSGIFFVDRSNSGNLLEHSKMFEFYSNLNFHLLDINLLKKLFVDVNESGQKYNFYKNYDYTPHFNLFETILNHKNKKLPRTINIKIPYDVSGTLSPGRGSGNTGSTVVEKLYRINKDGTISEFIDIHFPTKTANKLSVRLINNGDNHTLFYSFNKEDSYKYIERDSLIKILEEYFFERYQAAVKKHINIKDAEYRADYIALLHMIKI